MYRFTDSVSGPLSFSVSFIITQMSLQLQIMLFFFLALCSDVKFATTPDLNLLYTSDNLFMQIVEPEEISYVYKVRPAKNFGGEFVSERILQVIFFKNAITE